jgi:hypothetical protein
VSWTVHNPVAGEWLITAGSQNSKTASLARWFSHSFAHLCVHPSSTPFPSRFLLVPRVKFERLKIHSYGSQLLRLMVVSVVPNRPIVPLVCCALLLYFIGADPFEDVLPSDTLAAILLLLSELPEMPPAIPRIVVRHQIYTVVNDRTIADRELVRDVLCLKVPFEFQ